MDTFLRSGNLVGAGGHVFYESVRRDEAASVEGGLGGGSRGGARGARRTCFVSLADQVRRGEGSGREGLGRGGRGA